MPTSHKNKTLATLLAAVAGGAGLHRFYLFGTKDFWGWIHLATVPLTVLLIAFRPEAPMLFTSAPFVASALAGFLEALVIGLTPDERWRFSIYATNITNEAVWQTLRPGALSTDGFYEKPREVGVGVEIRF